MGGGGRGACERGDGGRMREGGDGGERHVKCEMEGGNVCEEDSGEKST